MCRTPPPHGHIFGKYYESVKVSRQLNGFKEIPIKVEESKRDKKL